MPSDRRSQPVAPATALTGLEQSALLALFAAGGELAAHRDLKQRLGVGLSRASRERLAALGLIALRVGPLRCRLTEEGRAWVAARAAAVERGEAPLVGPGRAALSAAYAAAAALTRGAPAVEPTTEAPAESGARDGVDRDGIRSDLAAAVWREADALVGYALQEGDRLRALADLGAASDPEWSARIRAQAALTVQWIEQVADRRHLSLAHGSGARIPHDPDLYINARGAQKGDLVVVNTSAVFQGSGADKKLYAQGKLKKTTNTKK